MEDCPGQSLSPLTLFGHASIIYYEGNIAFIVIGANGIVRGEKVTSLARWPPNPSRCWALTMEDYWARSGGLLAVGPLFNLGRSVSTRSPNHGRLRDGRVGIKNGVCV